MSILARSLAMAVVICLLGGHVMAAELKSETVMAWGKYVHLTEERIEGELQGVDSSLLSEVLSLEQIVVLHLETLDRTGQEIPVPKGIIHHWRGAVLIPQVLLGPTLQIIRNSSNRANFYEDVLESRLLEKRGDVELSYLKLQRSQAMVEVAYNTEHRAEYRSHSEAFVSSRSIATKIAEIVDLGKDTEREKPEGNDRGYLWKLNTYWKYRQVEQGVLVECETLTLSRSIPMLLKFILGPFINNMARKSMVKTLESLQTRVLSELELPETP
jgi:hypothetical protein